MPYGLEGKIAATKQREARKSAQPYSKKDFVNEQQIGALFAQSVFGDHQRTQGKEGIEMRLFSPGHK